MAAAYANGQVTEIFGQIGIIAVCSSSELGSKSKKPVLPAYWEAGSNRNGILAAFIGWKLGISKTSAIAYGFPVLWIHDGRNRNILESG